MIACVTSLNLISAIATGQPLAPQRFI